MATLTAKPRTPEPPFCAGQVVLRAVGWDGYTELLRLRGDRRWPRLAYLDGDVSLMSPAYRHEALADRVLLLVVEVALGLGIPCKTCGSTTFRRENRKGGGEADASFYLATAHQVRHRDDLDLNDDPPPDLVVEVVNTHPADAATEVWRRFGVPEVWVVAVDRLTILTLHADGSYGQASQSRAFPTLTASEVHEQLARDPQGLVTEWLPEVRRWVAEVVAPRRPRIEGGA